MTTKPYPVKSEIIHVPMRDGVKLSVHVHRPDVKGPFPAILSYTPYRKSPLGAPPPIVPHGYATVSFDIRGTGNSEGTNDSIYSAAERQDGYDMVEWAAAQPWCNGNVGMWGISFGAVVSLQMAMAAPPHLKAIIARSGTDDPYTEWTNPGGSPRPYMYENYSTIMTARNFSPPDPGEVGERWAEMWAERLEKNVPWGIPFIQNLEDGPFWRERSLRDNYDRVKCAVFVVGGWADWYHTPLLRTFANLNVPKRALIGPWGHLFPDGGIPGPRINWLPEALKWFDYWLKGIDTGVMNEPPVTLFVREYSKPATIIMEDKGTFRCENEWPIARAKDTPMYFGERGRLSQQTCEEGEQDEYDILEYDARVGGCAGMHGGGPSSINWFMPLDQRPDEAHSLTYTTQPLEEDVEVTGLPRTILHFSSTARITLFVVKLCDVAPDGTSALVTKGYLNVAHRESHRNPSYIEPGKFYEIEIELLTCAYRFRKGHRIRVDIANSDFLNVWPTPEPCTNNIYHSAMRPSCIVLPIVPPRGTEELSEPDLGLSPHPPARRENLTPPKFSVNRDIINDTATVAYEMPDTHAASFTVSAPNPAQAVVEATAQFVCDYQGQHIVVGSQCVTSSDDQTFCHAVEVEITVDGKRHFNKSWKESVPRRFC